MRHLTIFSNRFILTNQGKLLYKTLCTLYYVFIRAYLGLSMAENIFLSKYLFVIILCEKMSSVMRAWLVCLQFSTLSRMAVFSAFNISWNHHQFGLSSLSQLVLPYTEEEESWLDQQFRLLDEAHGSVSFGEDTTREFMLYSLDVPVSKTYMKGKRSTYNSFRVQLELHLITHTRSMPG